MLGSILGSPYFRELSYVVRSHTLKDHGATQSGTLNGKHASPVATLCKLPRPVINKRTTLNEDHNRDPNIKALERGGFII